MSTQPASDTDTETSSETDVSPPRDEKIRLEHITKQFGKIVAIDDVSFSVRDNEILAIVGDNGAGKSTLMKVLSGIHAPTEGQLYYEGEPVSFGSPIDARDHGIETVYQDLALMDDLNIAENIFGGRYPTKSIGPFSIIDWDRTYTATEEIIQTLNQTMDVHTEVAFLSGGQRQLVAIGRGLQFDPDVLIFDEPTSALSVEATQLVHDTMEQLQQQGRTQIIVGHDIEEVLEVADRVAVLYHGSLVTVADTDTTSTKTITELMRSGK